jgi:hypothetical protein
MIVIWTEQSTIDYWENIEYLEYRWGLKVTLDFIERVEDIITLLKAQNFRFKETKYKNIYEVPIVNQISLFYEINDSKINLMRFWNNYQDRNNLKLQ